MKECFAIYASLLAANRLPKPRSLAPWIEECEVSSLLDYTLCYLRSLLAGGRQSKCQAYIKHPSTGKVIGWIQCRRYKTLLFTLGNVSEGMYGFFSDTGTGTNPQAIATISLVNCYNGITFSTAATFPSRDSVQILSTTSRTEFVYPLPIS